MVRHRKPPSQTWRTFLDNHLKTLVSVDFFVVPTIRFQILYVFLVLAHDRRRILHCGVTAHPIAEWAAQQLREAFPWDSAPRCLLRDRDRIFGREFVDAVKTMGIKQVLSAPRSPWQRAYVERLIGSIRRECLNHVIVSPSGLCTITFPPMRIIIIGGAPIWHWRKTLQNHAERNCQSRDASSSCES